MSPSQIETTAKKKAANAPEIIIGLVTPLGTDGELITNKLAEHLEGVTYTPEIIHLMDDLHKLKVVTTSRQLKGLNRIRARIKAGDDLCANSQRQDAMALWGLRLIFARRLHQELSNLADPTDTAKWTQTPHRARTAYIIRSLKRPDEIHTLRRVYGPWVLIVGVFASPGQRESYLALRNPSATEDEIKELLRTDSKETRPYGQNTRAAFAQADFFVDAHGDYDREIKRFVRLVFGDRRRTPKEEEYGMFHAWAAALRSSSPALQVGASVCDTLGEVISVGVNEVPRADGGYYWDLDPEAPHAAQRDGRETGLGQGEKFPEVERKRRLLKDTLIHLKPLLKPEEAARLLKSDDAIDKLRREEMKGSELTNVIEFQRVVHAEMAALLNAQRHNSNLHGATLYTTSFPCHICAKHLLAAGIAEVVYVEPYPKSRAFDLYPKEITLDKPDIPTRRSNGAARAKQDDPSPVPFRSFIGIAPRLYPRVFAAQESERMEPDGTIKLWFKEDVVPRLGLADESHVTPAEDAAIRAAELSMMTVVDAP